MDPQIQAFLDGRPHAVVGASQNRSKYGNRVLRAYIQQERQVYPVNPSAGQIEGLSAFPDLVSLPTSVHGVSIVTPPDVAASIVEQAKQLDIGHLWFQPGAEDPVAVEQAKQYGMNVIAGGPCVLIEMGYRGDSALG